MVSKLFRPKMEVFPMFKGALLEVSLKDASKWSAEVEDYLNKKFPYLSGELRPVNFSETDAEEGAAVGTVVWSSGGKSITIPIIIEEFKLKEPDLAIQGEKIIPLNEEFINWRKEEGSVGELREETDPTEHMDYVKGLFEVTDVDDQGNPIGVKTSASRSTIERVQKIIDFLPRSDVLPVDLLNNIKIAKCPEDIKDPIDCVLDEIPEKPFHFRGTVLFKEGTGSLIMEDIEIAASEAKKIREKVAQQGKTTSLYFDAEKLKDEIPIVKKIAKSGRYKVFVDGKMRESQVFCDLFTVEGSNPAENSLVYCRNNEDKDVPNEPIAPKSDDAIKPTEQIVEYWQYGKIYGANIDPETSKDKYVSLNLDVEKMDGFPDLEKGYFIFVVPDHSISSPYKIIRYQEYKLGKHGETIKLLDAMSLATGHKIRCWLEQNVVKPTKINKAKMRTNEYAPLTDIEYDIYMIPDAYKVYLLPRDKDEPIVPQDHYKELFDEKQKDFVDDFTVKTSDEYGPGYYDIEVLDHNSYGSLVSFTGLDKNAAFLYARHYMGTTIDDLKRIKLGEKYRILPIEKNATAFDISPFERYRGEWIKTAYMILNNKPIQRVAKYIHTNPKKFPHFKLADVKDLVDSITSVEFADKQNIGSVKDIIPVLIKSTNMVGQLLLVSRVSKIDLSENVLARCFKALVELINEIRGKNAIYE